MNCEDTSQHVYDMVAIVASALRESAGNLVLIEWLRKPKPDALGAMTVLKHLCRYGKWLARRTLLIRAGQYNRQLDSWSREEPVLDFLMRVYGEWYEHPDNRKKLAKVPTEEELIQFLEPIVPEREFIEMGGRFPTIDGVVAFCDRVGINHVVACSNPHSSFLYLKLDGLSGRDLWADLWHRSQTGWIVNYNDLVTAIRAKS